MSSYKRKISAKDVRITEHPKALNDRIYVDEEQFEDIYMSGKKMTIQEKVIKLEQEMFEELERKKQGFIDRGYEEGKEIAIQEAENRIQKQVERILEQANQLYTEANAYKKKILDEAEAIKIKAFAEQKEDFLELIAESVKTIIQNDISVDDIRMDKIYMDAMKKITYDTRRVSVRIHPIMKSWMEQQMDDIKDVRLEVYYDVNLSPGDLLIETDKEYINASVEQKIERLKEMMRGVVNEFI